MILAAATLSGCGAGDVERLDAESGDELMSVDESLELGTLEQGLLNCANPEGANGAMAAFAVAVGKELGRWNVTKDFVIARTNGIAPNTTGSVEVLKLSSGSDASGSKGSSRCASGCPNVQALLDMQYDQLKGKVFLQGSGTTKVELVPLALRSRLVAKWREQEACDKNAKEPDANACPKEEHKLTFVKAAKGSCDMDFTFNVKRTDGTALKYPNQLKHKLRFADPANPYINFTPMANGDFRIDPLYGLNDDGVSSAGSCATACTKVSTTNVAGQCCSCGGASKVFAKTTLNPNIYLCQ